MSNHFLITATELRTRRGEPGLRILDASWYLPAANRDPIADFAAGHIPGAVFFDIDKVVDPASTLPHTLAPETVFTAAARSLGIDDRDEIIVYDTAGLFSAARLWWNFRIAGASRIRVLDGGLPAWSAIGGPLESGSPTPQPGNFTARYDLSLLRTFDDVLATVTAGTGSTIIDARSAARFAGEVPEPRPGVQSGHITGSRSVPFATLLDATGQVKPASDLRATFSMAGVDLDGPIIASCGSGVTAAVVALGLVILGRPDVPIYDGSWSEWGAREESRKFIATGSA
ncbi:3-mercaptopyruvate sulfurtransferase [Devosia sp. ZB163]|uniref:3-mercaptopyruvate sulfurtransferase n=1 Tax=Devosia sp. ZB163 TaxID=3025938 RepID=UPI0023602609|nr:3-mercaptopyruvate sulfurtransferase [Devosia sp. ZB163]MDC9826243.1 3-mercaptopyruvate sulfurtransferase [Devosia sp. ZB163]